MLNKGEYIMMLEFKIKLLWNRIRMNLGINQDEIYYIGGKTVLPPPLNKEEESHLIHLLPTGDKVAKATLIDHNLRLVVYIAKKLENTGIHIEDLISIGSIGLIIAVNTFNAEKNIKLATYVSRCIENEILMYLRKSNRMKTEVSFDEPLNIDWDGNELLLSDVLGTEVDLITKDLETKVDKQLLIGALTTLNPREQKIMERRFSLVVNEDQTQKYVEDMLRTAQCYISRLEKKIIRRFQKEFQKMV